MKLFSLSILTPEKKIFEGEVVSLIAPAELGYLGVWADHAPLVANLSSGNISFRKKEEDTPVVFEYKGDGFLEVFKNKVTLLLSSPLTN